MSQYSDLSIEMTKVIDKKIKKEQGIFISPRSIIEKLSQAVFKYASMNGLSLQRILEPSCGTCEIINYLDKELNKVESIDGVELNSTIFNKILALDFVNQINLTQYDFLRYTCEYEYDLIIGNPPYVVCNKADIPTQYQSFVVGQANLFGVFILHSLSMLKPNGLLAFIIPKSFLNSCYYAKVRNYIMTCCRIVEIIDFTDGSFLDTQQATFGLVLHKMVGGSIVSANNYAIKLSNDYVFCANVSLFKSIKEGSTTLELLGLCVKTGSVVWNEKYKDDTKNKTSKNKNKEDLLTSDNSKTLLLYNSNVTPENTIKLMDFKNDKKKQYILMAGSSEPVIVVNRGNGNSAYKLNYAFVSPNIVGGPYLVENHLNVIYSSVERPAEVLTALYEQIMASFKDPRSQQFIDMFCGNNALSKTELEKVFPIYL